MDNNTDPIERILKNAPQPSAPSDLLPKLIANRPHRFRNTGVLMSWLPRLGFASLFLMGAVWIVAQNGRGFSAADATKQLQAAREEQRSVEANHAKWKQQTDRLAYRDRLQAQVEEVAALEREKAQLTERVAEARSLARATQTLRQQLAVLQPSMRFLVEDPVGDARAKAQSIQCVNHLKQLGLAYRIGLDKDPSWNPQSLDELLPYVGGEARILACPADPEDPGTPGGPDADQARLYRWKLADPAEVNVRTVITACPVHGHVGLYDGSVHQGGAHVQTLENGNSQKERFF